MKKKFVIGMSGPSGAGKTTIGKKLAKKLKAKLINLDDYWKYHNTKINLKKDWKKLEHPSSIDFSKLYNDIIKSKEDSKQKKFILVEGFHLFYNKKIRNLFDLCIYITVPDHLVVKRRVDKFGPEQNQEWYSKNIVIKCYKKYGEPTKKHADLIIRGEENINKNIKKILACLKK
jgi:uridine kinase